MPRVADPSARVIPTTVDEATADPPPPASQHTAVLDQGALAARPHAGMPTALGHAVPAPSPGLGPGPASSPSPPVAAGTGAGPAPRPHAGLPTSIGHAAVPVGAAGPAAPAQPAQPAPRPHAALPTTVGHAVAPPAAPPPTLGKTLFDAVPFGAQTTTGGGAGNTVSQRERPTPLVPPAQPDQQAPPERFAPPPSSVTEPVVVGPPKPLAKTMNDPSMADRARAVREAALAEIAAKKDADNALAAAGASPAPPSSRDPSSGSSPVFGKTMVLGGVAASEPPTPAAPPAPAPAPKLRADRYDEIADLPTQTAAPPTPALGVTAASSPKAIQASSTPQAPPAEAPKTLVLGATARTPSNPQMPALGSTTPINAGNVVAPPPRTPSNPQMPALGSTTPINAGNIVAPRTPSNPQMPALGGPPGGAGAQASPLSKSVFSPSSAPPPAPASGPSGSIKTPVQSAAMQPAPMQPAPILAAAPSSPPAPPPSAPAAGQQPTPLGATFALGAAGSDKQTMLGMPANELPASPSHSHSPNPPAAAPSAPVFPPVMKTMMGVAMPGIAPTHTAAQPQQPGAPVERAGTLLGVAAPGVAPMHPGAPQQHQQPPQQHHHQQQQQQQHYQQPQQQQPAPPIVPAPAPLQMEPLPEAPRAPSKKGVPAIAVVAIVFVLVLLIGGGAYVLFLRAGAPLTAQPQLDEAGKESLKIRCESCPDGTVISLGASSAKVVGAATLLPLPAPLSIGDNDLEMKIDRPASGRDETVKIHVPVAYRVKADLTTLTSSPPAITVRVEAMPSTEVTVDGKPVTLDGNGKGSQTIDVTAEVDGPSDDQKAIDKKIPFSIKPKGTAAPETGQLVVRAGVVPLHIDAPGRELFTDRGTANVSGQTKPGGTLTIDNQAVAIDDKGRFGVRVELPGDGEKILTITANAPPLAPRTMRAKVTRVASLGDGAKLLDAKTPPPIKFDVFSVDPASKIGQLVVIDGEVIDTRVQQGHTVMLIDEKKACPTGGGCIVRLVHGEEVPKSARGDSVHAYGLVEGTVTSGGKTVPDIEGALVISQPANPKKK